MGTELFPYMASTDMKLSRSENSEEKIFKNNLGYKSR